MFNQAVLCSFWCIQLYVSKGTVFMTYLNVNNVFRLIVCEIPFYILIDYYLITTRGDIKCEIELYSKKYVSSSSYELKNQCDQRPELIIGISFKFSSSLYSMFHRAEILYVSISIPYKSIGPYLTKLVSVS